jgi:hypothetical protein
VALVVAGVALHRADAGKPIAQSQSRAAHAVR